ncbi:MAG: hypothetical protein HYZ81_16130 [Nitrospinae bacterium]|nr:hypothetical protein [Nitrospinota bacterium]
MASIPLVLHTEPYYKAFREGRLRWGVPHPPVATDRFMVVKADFRSRHAHLLLPEDQQESDNIAFAHPLVLPRHGAPFHRAVIILHGLNESEYRKFFPWACTLASAGLPVILFPITFLVNRRPRMWRGKAKTQQCLRARQSIPGNTVATRFNTVLSERLDRHPERLFLGGRQSYCDLLDLAASLYNGTLTVDGPADGALVPRQPFGEGTGVDFLAYSIGGYLTLGLLLEQGDNPHLANSRAVIFCAAAPITHNDPALNTNPLSPFILDGRATEHLGGFYRSADAEPLLANPEGRWCRAIFRAEHAVLGPRLRNIRSRVLTIGNTADMVVPAAGMEVTLGPLDHILTLGAHEYPFSVADVWQSGVTRRIAKSYNIHPAYEAGFREFMQAVIEFVGR